MILAQWKGRWFIASKARPDTPSCALIGGNWPGLSELGFIRQERSMGRQEEPNYRRWFVWHRFMPTMDDITFISELRYKGLKVYPEHWHPESEEPLLLCYMPTVMHPGEPESVWGLRRERLIEEGWEDGGRDGLKGYVHVDELEKIEGPPPTGSF
jgi:hypothetical protein